jgi:hypothetical protein
MIYVRHRVNTVAELEALPDRSWGAEIDLRSDVSRPGAIHLAHDPWKAGDSFADWLAAYARLGFRGPVIVNTKEDGLEERALELLAAHNITSFFFLDTALPTLVRWTGKGEKRFAVRVSSREPVEAALQFAGKAEWAWVDCFGAEPFPVQAVQPLVGRFRLCLVSPELQGAPLESRVRFQELAARMDAICTKDPKGWV